MSSRPRSAAAMERARRVLVGGVNSPVRSFRAVGGEAVVVARAQGAHLFDVDGNRYVDLVGSWGPAIAGHAHPRVVEAVQRAAESGLSFGACCEAETLLAERIIAALPAIEMLRFVSSGTEAAMSAIRLARAATRRHRLIKFRGCYHGHCDALLAGAGSGAATLSVPDSAGVPPEVVADTLLAPFNDAEAVERLLAVHGHTVAAILVEPVAGNMGMVEPVPGFLESLRRLCDRHGALLVFDEVMTGFRVAWGGAQNWCGVAPDVTLLGKVIGGGLPVAAYGASRRLMSLVSPLGPMYQAGTLSGNPLGMAAGLATLDLCSTPGFYEALDSKSRRLANGIAESAARRGVALQAVARGGMLGLFFSGRAVRDFDGARVSDHALFAKFFRAMLEHGVWLPPSGYEAMFLSSAHADADLDHVLSAAAESLAALSS